MEDVGVDAVKIGMLFNSPIIRKVAEFLRENPVPFLVVDPVMFAKSGDRLLLQDAIDLTDRVAKRANAQQAEQMHTAFVTSTRLEWMFWDSAYRMEQWKP